nr:unnamed protein product [Digitaria exilis]
MPRRRPPAGLRSDEATSMVVLMEELVEEVLLRFPPAEPASLVRAALVCKPWCRLISGRHFRRRFCEVHRSPPMLGYFCNLYPGKETGPVSRFFPASPACPPLPDQINRSALDARHGRVLLRKDMIRGCARLSVWDPVTGERWQLPPLSLDAWNDDDDDDDDDEWSAAVLCAASSTGCGHLDCRGKPFLVVCAGSPAGAEQIFLCVYSEPAVAAPRPDYGVSDQVPPALDGGMALGVENYSKLFLWSMETGSPKRDISWKKIRMIELNELLPVTVRDAP